LTDWLLDQGATQAHDISNLVPGDIVAYDADHNGWIEHVALYMGNGLVTAHSLSRYSQWNPDPTADFVFLHLPGAYHPTRTSSTLGILSWLLLVASVIRLAASVFFRLH
jgi:cell wall-associated NlpC family hydrolase